MQQPPFGDMNDDDQLPSFNNNQFTTSQNFIPISNNNNNNNNNIRTTLAATSSSSSQLSSIYQSDPSKFCTKCPLCTKNKQKCEESQKLISKMGIEKPFLKEQNTEFNEMVEECRKKAKLDIKKLNKTVRLKFTEFMTKIKNTQFNSWEEYENRIIVEYYDKLHEVLNQSWSEALNEDEEYCVSEDEEYCVSEEEELEEDEKTHSTQYSSGSDSDDSEYIDKSTPKRKMKQKSLPSSSSKKKKLEYSPSSPADTSTPSSSAVKTIVRASTPSSLSIGRPLTSSGDDLIYILGKEEGNFYKMYKLCLLNMSDFESIEKFRSAIKQEMEIKSDEFTIYFTNIKLKKDFKVETRSALETLKQQSSAVKPMKEKIIVKYKIL